MSKYDEKTDLELSELVALKFGKKVTHGLCADRCVIGVIGGANGNYTLIYFDINNPADMWPIIVGNGIGVICDSDRSGYYATNGWLHFSGAIHADDFECWHKNPLRAAAIVFLMMKDAE